MVKKEQATAPQRLQAMAAGRRRIDAAYIRRGGQFLINIGAPLVVGAVRRGRPAAGDQESD